MRLLIVGCEYAGKTTLARAISHRLLAAMAGPTGPRPIQWHGTTLSCLDSMVT